MNCRRWTARHRGIRRRRTRRTNFERYNPQLTLPFPAETDTEQLRRLWRDE